MKSASKRTIVEILNLHAREIRLLKKQNSDMQRRLDALVPVSQSRPVEPNRPNSSSNDDAKLKDEKNKQSRQQQQPYDYTETYDPRVHIYVPPDTERDLKFLRRYAWQKHYSTENLYELAKHPKRIPSDVQMCDVMNHQFHNMLVTMGLMPPPFKNYGLTRLQVLVYKEMFVSRSTDRLHEIYARM